MEYRKEKITGYTDYQVDTNGIIYGKTGNPLKYSINHGGYQIVNLCCNGKRKGFSVHTLVARQFLSDKYNEGLQVNHIDGNKQNNNVENLEWVTPKANIEHLINTLNFDNSCGKHAKAKKIISVDQDGKCSIFQSISEAAKALSIIKDKPYRYIENSIWRVLTGKRKSYNGLLWDYV